MVSMAHGDRSRTVIAFVASAFAMFGLASCDSQTEQSPSVPKRISGVVDDRYYVHPKITEPGRTGVKGCCSFDLDAAKVTKLLGDIDGRQVEGNGFQMEIAFGSRIPPLNSPFALTERRQIDGVSAAFLQAGSRRYALEATVPLSREAENEKIDFPRLQVVGTCDGTSGCERLADALKSVRF